jgi:hypothetical protein
MKIKSSIVAGLLLCSSLMGCFSALYNVKAEMTATPDFKFEKGQRIAVLPVTVNGNPTLKTDAASTAAFAVHLANIGYKVYELDQLRLEAKKNGATLPDSLGFDTYPLIAKATGIQLILQSSVEYVTKYSGTSGAKSETSLPRSQSMSILDATTGAVLVRGIVHKYAYSDMSEVLTDGLADLIRQRSYGY